MGSDLDHVTALIDKLALEFKVRDMGVPSFFLGIEIVPLSSGMLLSQQRYMKDILKRVGMVDCKSVIRPVSSAKITDDVAVPYANPTQYRSLVGALQYLTQRTVARSSTKAEYKGLADVSAEVPWLVSLLHEIGILPAPPPRLWCDNLGATYLCANPVFYARKKHIEIGYHFVRDKVAKNELEV
ncbi:PREDICTED: uncharacterized protein LOC109158048 [Ipomoea nil]|uniref:uncharacterized protein LOC109158048 n=1 Tax=Ipomoea nil TaxID=35883 RepID=UPI000900AABD|nr:PREDICTED: uncharacterized protein LOC109158048 [Ipomoea nil]